MQLEYEDQCAKKECGDLQAGGSQPFTDVTAKIEAKEIHRLL
jgi:hypothetical protein